MTTLGFDCCEVVEAVKMLAFVVVPFLIPWSAVSLRLPGLLTELVSSQCRCPVSPAQASDR